MGWILTGVVISAIGGVAGLAGAQTPEPRAAALADSARRAHLDKRLDEAIATYARAYQEGGDPELLFSMAEAHREAGNETDAIRTFQTYLRRDPRGVHRDSASRQVEELQQAVRARRHTARRPGAVRFSTAALTAGNRAAGSSGSRSPSPPSPSSPPPSSSASSLPAPLSPPLPPLPPAAPMVDLAAAPARAPSGQNPPMPRWIPWTLALTTAALGTGAIVTGISAGKRLDDLNDSCGQAGAGCSVGARDDVRWRARRANLLWALTGVAAVATGVTVYVNASAVGLAGLWSF